MNLGIGVCSCTRAGWVVQLHDERHHLYGGSVMSSGGLPMGQIAGGIMNFVAHDTLYSGYLMLNLKKV